MLLLTIKDIQDNSVEIESNNNSEAINGESSKRGYGINMNIVLIYLKMFFNIYINNFINIFY